jgi:hypothetical protein
MIAFPKPTRWKSKKYRDAARDQNCTMRLPGCRNDTATTVLAHENGAGMATKASDHNAADMCSHCHAIFDRPDHWPFSWDVMNELFSRARFETIINRIERKILK